MADLPREAASGEGGGVGHAGSLSNTADTRPTTLAVPPLGSSVPPAQPAARIEAGCLFRPPSPGATLAAERRTTSLATVAARRPTVFAVVPEAVADHRA